jgi:heme exporter protein D
MELGPHAVFIVAAYVVTAAIIAGLIVHAVLGHRAQRRALAALEGRGVRRRSENPTSSAQPSLGSGVVGKG